MQKKAVKRASIKKKRPLTATRAVAKYRGESEEIVQALDIMRRAQMVKSRHPITFDRYTYHSI